MERQIEPTILYPGKIKLTRPTFHPIGSQYGELNKCWLWHLDETGKWVRGQKDGFGAHKGYDFLCPVGSDIRAMSDGFIIRAGWEDATNEKVGFGLRLVQQIEFEGIHYMLYYGHLSVIEPNLNKVKTGMLLGKSGNSGRSSGPHTHVEARNLNQESTPIEWL